jgi:predicted ribosome quality control (RQC) complex YloA/Tae2 family protein
MKTNLASIEIHYLVNELQFLIGSRVDNIYHPKKDEIILQLHTSGKGKQILRIISGKLFYLASVKEPASEPSGFCMFLRKHMGNSRLKGIKQIGSERIVEFDFGDKKLMVELFGKGNILLCENGIILSALVYHKWKDREIRAKLEYSYPKMEYNLFDLSLKDISDIFDKSEKALVKCLATEVGFGGVYSEEVCLRADIDKNTKARELEQKEVKVIFQWVNKLVGAKKKPAIIYDKGVKDIVPFALEIYKTLEKREFLTYNEAFDYYFLNEVKKEKPLTQKEKQIIEALAKKEVEQRKKGELIYENYQMVNDIINEIRKALKKHDWEEIERRLKGHKVVKVVNSKDKTVEVEI